MKKSRPMRTPFRSEPLHTANFPVFERLFGERGACGGCWCMTPRLTRREYEGSKGEPNRRAMRKLAARDLAPGVLVFKGGDPDAVGWCAVGPREEFLQLKNSRILAPVDSRPVFSIVCLFVAKTARRTGVSVAAIEAAVEYAKSHGAECVEAYPIAPKKEDVPPVFAYPGLLAAYEAAGFVEVARRSPTRPIVRRDL